jgi:ubiquinone biosynthesis protein Coq4
LPEVVIYLVPLTEERQIFQAWLEQLLDLEDLPQVVTDELGLVHCQDMQQESHWEQED